jgi:hypothetical protein
MKKFIFLFSFFLFPFSFFSQEVSQYGHAILDTMTAKGMHGRGYVQGGDSIAALYLAGEFRKHNLNEMVPGYYQSFSFPVNTFPGKMEFEFDLIDMISSNSYSFDGRPGANFIVDPGSPTIETDFKLKIFDSTYCSEEGMKRFKKKLKKKWDFILIDDRNVVSKDKLAYFKQVKANIFKAKGIIEIVKKLTWEQSQTVLTYPRIFILADSFQYKGKHDLIDAVGGTIIESKLLKAHETQNICGYVKGSVYPDSFIVFSAHYDHLGHMGKDTYFPGANDNASGCAMLLNLARYYSRPENRPKCSIAFIAFAGEEVGLLGSKFYTEHPPFPLRNIKFELNMDIMGTGEDGITVVNGSVFQKEFDKLKAINLEKGYLKEVKIRGKAANSDHYFFSEKGVKAFFIYTMGGIKAYHDIYDKAETLPLNEFEDLFKLITDFQKYLDN